MARHTAGFGFNTLKPLGHLVQLVHRVAGVARHDLQQRLLLRQHLAPLDRDLDRLPLARGRHARLLQHGCARTAPPNLGHWFRRSQWKRYTQVGGRRGCSSMAVRMSLEPENLSRHSINITHPAPSQEGTTHPIWLRAHGPILCSTASGTIHPATSPSCTSHQSFDTLQRCCENGHSNAQQYIAIEMLDRLTVGCTIIISAHMDHPQRATKQTLFWN